MIPGMSGPQRPASDPMLSDTLSARSYLELPHETHQADEGTAQIAQITQNAVVPTPPRKTQPTETQGILAPSLRPRGRRLPQGSGMPETTSETQDLPSELPAERPMRKRGRPRLETAKDAAAIEERRLQIRRAQRTYRQKKEATITALKTRVEALEQTLQTVSELLDPVGDKTSVDRARRLVLAEIDQTRPYPGVGQSQFPDQNADTLHDVFGYHVSRDADQRLDLQHQDHSLPPPPRPRSPTPLLNRLFPTSTIYTYSYQESSLSRRLQRFCVEHVYRWLSDPRTDAHLMIRVFGLLPCIHDMPGVRRAFRRVLQSEIGSSMEGSKLPFYTLGGAGQHYPRTDQDGRPVYPEKMRRPGKILRRLARILRRGSIQDWDEDWSGDAEPRMDEFHDMDKAMSDEDRLRSLDLDGDWFDCHDVQGYLEHRGVVLNGSSLWLEVPGETVGTLHGLSPDQSASELYASSEEISPGETSLSQYMGQSKYVLNVENFFELLLANLRILGRAPGFRLWDVDAALRTSIHRRPFS